jgi:hypothetical protein
MIPPVEINRFTDAIHDAIGLAADGYLTDGFELLLQGRRRAELLQQEGVPWGHELVERWRQACDNYAHNCGVPFE